MLFNDLLQKQIIYIVLSGIQCYQWNFFFMTHLSIWNPTSIAYNGEYFYFLFFYIHILKFYLTLSLFTLTKLKELAIINKVPFKPKVNQSKKKRRKPTRRCIYRVTCDFFFQSKKM
jgi:hypothetical protein